MAFLPMVWLICTGVTFWRYWPVGDFLGTTHILVNVQITFSLFAASPPPLPLLLIIHSTAVFANHSVIHSAFVAIIFNIFMVVYHESNVLSLASGLRGWPFCCCCGLDWIALFTV